MRGLHSRRNVLRDNAVTYFFSSSSIVHLKFCRLCWPCRDYELKALDDEQREQRKVNGEEKKDAEEEEEVKEQEEEDAKENDEAKPVTTVSANSADLRLLLRGFFAKHPSCTFKELSANVAPYLLGLRQQSGALYPPLTSKQLSSVLYHCCAAIGAAGRTKIWTLKEPTPPTDQEVEALKQTALARIKACTDVSVQQESDAKSAEPEDAHKSEEASKHGEKKPKQRSTN